MARKMHSIIDDLLDPVFLPDKTEHVSIVQTHISFVIVADEFVYKIKKPVNFGFLDFSTLKKRRYYCHQEIILNRRLSKDTYLGVLPTVYDGKIHSMGIGKGRIVEYAVKMNMGIFIWNISALRKTSRYLIVLNLTKDLDILILFVTSPFW